MEIDTVTKNYSARSGLHCSYQVTYKNTNTVRSVPLDVENTDYQEIQQWIVAGNTVTDPGE
tara:strand:- start:79 stop:261 length:183 start_codon:yes stop_codon:yes gene_type:complete